MKDQWRFLKLVELYYEGNLSLSDFTQLSSHVKVGYMALFLGNAIFFNLNITAEIILSMLLFIVCLYFISVTMHKINLKMSTTEKHSY